MKPRLAVAWSAKVIIAVVFLYAGAVKAWHPAQLQTDIERYRLVSESLAWAAAAWLPYLEIFGALALLHARTVAAGQVILVGLLMVFIAALASAWLRGLNVSCGCFGSTTDNPNYGWWISRDLLLLAGVAILRLRTAPLQRQHADPQTAAGRATRVADAS